MPARKSDKQVIAGMATMPSRAETAPSAIASILGQVDHLYLYLDGFDAVPAYALHPRITTIRCQDTGNLRGAGKFLAYAQTPADGFCVIVDDDIAFPPSFVTWLRLWNLLLGRSSIVGIHGSVFRQQITSYVKDRRVWAKHHTNYLPKRVDVVAACGILLRGGQMTLDPHAWTYINQSDLNLAFGAQADGMRSYVVPKRGSWVQALAEDQPDSIWSALQKNDEVQTQRVRELLGRT